MPPKKTGKEHILEVLAEIDDWAEINEIWESLKDRGVQLKWTTVNAYVSSLYDGLHLERRYTGQSTNVKTDPTYKYRLKPKK